MQRAWSADPKYLDTEFVVYHYPEQYFDRILGGEKFVYYRPSRGASGAESSCYFGCGELGDYWDDFNNPGHRFVGIRKPVRFPRAVSFRDPEGRMYESRFSSRSAFQGQSVRHVDDLDFHRILSAAGLIGSALSEAPTVDDVIAGRVSPIVMEPPRDMFRPLDTVPEGTGYRPTGLGPDVFEAAALQERARADHQRTLQLLKRSVEAAGGLCEFNNNVDMLALFDEKKLLVEVKSLSNPASTVDRMRYGIGQLADYAVRYRDQVGMAQRILAFGSPLPGGANWVPEILDGNAVAFIVRDKGEIVPGNELARTLPLFRQ